MLDFLLSLFHELLLPVVISIFSAYIFLLLVKKIIKNKLKKNWGHYTHSKKEESGTTITNFRVSPVKDTFYNPIPNISICIERIKGDSQDWKGIFNSDILNPHYFKGIYIITDPGENDKDGWHEIYFFQKPTVKIAFNLHHLDEKSGKWIIDQGYYIEKERDLD